MPVLVLLVAWLVLSMVAGPLVGRALRSAAHDSAGAPRGAVYPNGVVKTGDPIFQAIHRQFVALEDLERVLVENLRGLPRALDAACEVTLAIAPGDVAEQCRRQHDRRRQHQAEEVHGAAGSGNRQRWLPYPHQQYRLGQFGLLLRRRHL